MEDYENGYKTNTDGKLDSEEKIDADSSGVSSWGASKNVAASEVVMNWGEDNAEVITTECETVTSSGWGETFTTAAFGSAEPSSWGQDGVGSAAGWVEAVGVTLPESSSGSSVVGETPAVEKWGKGKQEWGEGWGR